MTSGATASKPIRARAWAVSFLSVLGIYLAALSNHKLAYGVFAFVVCSFLFMTCSEMYTVAFFLLPYSMIFKGAPANTSLFSYLVIVVAGIAMIKTRKMRTNVCLLLLVLAAYMLVGMGNGLATYLKLVLNVFLFYGFIANVRPKVFPKIICALSLGTILSGFIGLQKQTNASLASFFSVVKTEYIGGVETVRFSGLYLDPNYFSIIVIACLFGLAVYMFKKEIGIVFGLILASALCVFGCLTISKIFYITLAIGVAFLVGIYAKISKKIVKAVFVAIIVGGIAFYFASSSGIIDQIAFRFNADDISNNRLNIWSDYLAYIWEHVNVLILGAGINAEMIGGSGAHNFYIELAYYLGFLGAVLYIALYSTMVFTKPMVSKRTFGNYALLIVILVMYATLGTFFMNDFVFVLLIVWMMLNTEMKSDRNNLKVAEENDGKNVAAYASN